MDSVLASTAGLAEQTTNRLFAAEKLCFFINLHNLMLVHAFIESGAPKRTHFISNFHNNFIIPINNFFFSSALAGRVG